MDLRQIRYFVAVYEEGSISRAAEREHCTQPGISVQIQKLEAELSHKLFERQARGVVPTVAGRHLYGCCTGVLAELRAARQRMLDLTDSISGGLRIGVPPTFSLSALPRVLPAFLAEHPYVDVRVAEAFSGTLTSWVVEGELDVAIVTEPPSHLGLTTTPFFRDELVLVSSPGAARSGNSVTWAELDGVNLVVASEKHSLHETVAKRMSLADRTARTVEIDGMVATLEMVRCSDWVTVLPVSAVFERIKRGELVAQRFADGSVVLDFYLVHTNAEPVSVAARRLVDGLKQEAERMAVEWRSNAVAGGPRPRGKSPAQGNRRPPKSVKQRTAS